MLVGASGAAGAHPSASCGIQRTWAPAEASAQAPATVRLSRFIMMRVGESL